jgi:hypothetical protein
MGKRDVLGHDQVALKGMLADVLVGGVGRGIDLHKRDVRRHHERQDFICHKYCLDCLAVSGS